MDIPHAHIRPGLGRAPAMLRRDRAGPGRARPEVARRSRAGLGRAHPEPQGMRGARRTSQSHRGGGCGAHSVGGGCGSRTLSPGARPPPHRQPRSLLQHSSLHLPCRRWSGRSPSDPFRWTIFVEWMTVKCFGLVKKIDIAL
jgi:hypothetical protein